MWALDGARAWMRSRIDTLARPVRTVLKLRRTLSMLFSIFSSCGLRKRAGPDAACRVSGVLRGFGHAHALQRLADAMSAPPPARSSPPPPRPRRPCPWARRGWAGALWRGGRGHGVPRQRRAGQGPAEARTCAWPPARRAARAPATLPAGGRGAGRARRWARTPAGPPAAPQRAPARTRAGQPCERPSERGRYTGGPLASLSLCLPPSLSR